MNPLEEIETRLKKYPHVVYVRTANEIVVKAADDSGFDVGMSAQGPTCTVHFEGWHEDFDSPLDALNCFAFGLSDSCRLAVTYRGATPVAWTVESRDRDQWREDSTTGLILVPIWRKRRVIYKQNHIVPSGEPSSPAGV